MGDQRRDDRPQRASSHLQGLSGATRPAGVMREPGRDPALRGPVLGREAMSCRSHCGSSPGLLAGMAQSSMWEQHDPRAAFGGACTCAEDEARAVGHAKELVLPPDPRAVSADRLIDALWVSGARSPSSVCRWQSLGYARIRLDMSAGGRVGWHRGPSRWRSRCRRGSAWVCALRPARKAPRQAAGN